MKYGIDLKSNYSTTIAFLRDWVHWRWYKTEAARDKAYDTLVAKAKDDRYKNNYEYRKKEKQK